MDQIGEGRIQNGIKIRRYYNMKAKVYACVAEGLEEVECLAAADVMIRCGMECPAL